MMIWAYAVLCPTAKLSVTKHSLQAKPENPDAVDKSQIKKSVKMRKIVLNSKEGSARDQWRSRVKLSTALNRWEMLNKW